MSRFIYPVNFPSAKKELHFKELSYKNFKDFVKTVINNDKNSLCIFIDELLTELCIEPIKFSQLSSFDKFYMLVFLYGTNVSTSIQFTLTCPETKKPLNYTIDLAALLEKIDKLNLSFKHCITVQQIQYHFDFPRYFIVNGNIADTIAATISQTVNHKKVYDFASLTLDVKKQIIPRFPLQLFKNVSIWIEEQNQILQTVDFINVKSPHVEKDPPTIKYSPSLWDSSLLEFIKCLYRDDLASIYRLEYNFIRNLGFNYNTFSQITPAEITIYDGAEKEKQKKNTELPSRPPV